MFQTFLFLAIFRDFWLNTCPKLVRTPGSLRDFKIGLCFWNGKGKFHVNVFPDFENSKSVNSNLSCLKKF